MSDYVIQVPWPVGGKHIVLATRRTSLNKISLGLNREHITGFSGFSTRVRLREGQIYEIKCRKKHMINFILYELNICVLERIRLGCRDNDDKYC